ncbi:MULTISPECIES: hypothetical protein [Paenibacillus]|uniref:hypothetical protein n=1 Tax=Paenibacillus TaxID=44249 RepID=UPI00088D2AA8|nr:MULTISPECIES: hypothetical protein [Paenibacillus]SDJ91343.1 hypothetical protein SAMN05421868_15615 [Paenibacillus naphthalenovorans]
MIAAANIFFWSKNVRRLQPAARQLGRYAQMSRKHVFLLVPGTTLRMCGKDQQQLKLYKVSFQLFRLTASTDSRRRNLEVQRSIVPQNLSGMMDYVTLYLDHGQGLFFRESSCRHEEQGFYDTAFFIFCKEM